MSHRELSSVLCDEREESDGVGREASEGGAVYILIADAHYCIAETNTTL